MKVICAPDKFKGSLTAPQAAAAMRRGVLRAAPEAHVDLCPIADGGEGTVEALVAATGGTFRTTVVQGPLGDPVRARWGTLGDGKTAVIEMAAASGLVLVPPQKRDPLRASTFGTGQLIATALDAGCQTIIVGIGGSATTDGGVGMAQALGARFDPINLDRLDRRIAHTTIVVACDVTNPMTGPHGAAHVYGPQKGATPEQVELLDQRLRRLAQAIRERLGGDVEHLPGAGAAGGLGGGLVAFLGARLLPGVELVLDAVRFDQRVRGCDLCLTGEGRLDGQSLSGKAVIGVAQAARRQGVRTVALVGSASDDAHRTLAAGLHAYHVIAPHLEVEESVKNADYWLETRTAEVILSA